MDYLNFLKEYPAYSKGDIRYYNTFSSHKRLFEYKSVTDTEITAPSKNLHKLKKPPEVPCVHKKNG